MVVLLSVWIKRARKSEGELKKPIVHLLWLAIFTVIAQGVFFICDSNITATVAIGFYYAGIDWLLIVMLSYVEAYTRIFRGSRAAKTVVYGLAVLDSLNFILNIFINTEPSNINITIILSILSLILFALSFKDER